jgi:hypothetical protein
MLDSVGQLQLDSSVLEYVCFNLSSSWGKAFPGLSIWSQLENAYQLVPEWPWNSPGLEKNIIYHLKYLLSIDLNHI